MTKRTNQSDHHQHSPWWCSRSSCTTRGLTGHHQSFVVVGGGDGGGGCGCGGVKKSSAGDVGASSPGSGPGLETARRPKQVGGEDPYRNSLFLELSIVVLLFVSTHTLTLTLSHTRTPGNGNLSPPSQQSTNGLPGNQSTHLLGSCFGPIIRVGCGLPSSPRNTKASRSISRSRNS